MMENKKNSKNNAIPLFKNNAERENALSRDELRRRMKRKKQNKRKLRKLLMSLVLVLVLCGVGAALSLTVFFKIETINVEGASLYSNELVIENSTINVGDNLLSTDEKAVEESLVKKLPYIGAVTIEKKLPATITVKVTETREAAAVMSDGGYVLIAPDGKIVDASASLLRENVAVIEGVLLKEKTAGEYAVCEDEAQSEALTAVLLGIRESGIEGISSIDLSDTSDILMKYDFRIKLRLGTSSDITDKLKRAKAVLKEEDKINPQNVGTLDLRSEPYSYFKPGDDEATTEPFKKNEEETTESEAKPEENSPESAE